MSVCMARREVGVSWFVHAPIIAQVYGYREVVGEGS